MAAAVVICAVVFAVNKRLALAALLGVIIAGGVGGLMMVLAQTRAHTCAQLRAVAENRATLAAALIDSVLSGPYEANPQEPAPITGTRVTAGDIKASQRVSPLTAVLGPDGAVLASRPAIPAVTQGMIAAQPAVTTALRDGQRQLSNLLPPMAALPAGFVDVAPFRTRFGVRASATWLPLTSLASSVDGALADVAAYGSHRHGIEVFLLDRDDVVIGAAGDSVHGGRLSSTMLGRSLTDRPLQIALREQPRGGAFGAHASRFFAASTLRVAPWTVVYTLPTAVLYASDAGTWKLSLLLLLGLGLAVAVALALLLRLLVSTGRLAQAHAALGRRNAEIQRATEAKTRFVASLSHELRTPLNAVMGFAELMQQGRAGRVSQTQREYLEIVRGGADHLLALIDEALDLATIEAGQLRLLAEATDPARVARQCVAALQPLARQGDVGLELIVPPTGCVLLDAGRLRQVLLNFLSNAIKFSPAGGTVVVKLGHDGDRLTVAVSDEGVGIAPADQARVFEEFAQVGDGAGIGHGLGLAVTRRIVEAQGGEVGVQSVPGAGATFTAWLPWLPVEDAGDGERSHPISDARWQEMVARLVPPAAAEPPRERPVRPEGAGRAPRAAGRASQPASAQAERP